MRALVLSDIHSNLPALSAVLRTVQRKRIDAVLCLGDIVGYGAQPNQVVDRLRRLKAPLVCVRGNHDRAVADGDQVAGFNHAAREAVLWTRHRLTPENRRFILNLTPGPRIHQEVTLCHGSPNDEDEYLFGGADAAEAFDGVETPLTLFGHTHLPMVIRRDARGKISTTAIEGDAVVRLVPGERLLVNPGSVGQPRDRDPRVSYAILDAGRGILRFRRVAYDVEAAQRAILRAGLPEILAWRLGGGF